MLGMYIWAVATIVIALSFNAIPLLIAALPIAIGLYMQSKKPC